MTSEELLQQLRALAPWHMNIALTDDIRTGMGNPDTGDRPGSPMTLVNPDELRPLLERLYPNGLSGKRFLDCACNAAGYSLMASELGAEHCFAFDVREHWIDQARFVRGYLGKTDGQITIEVCDVLDLGPRLGSQRFDICLFKGIFYHLPDPVTGLRIVADRTDEILILDTAAVCGFEDGFLKMFREGVEQPMSGVHHLAWRPTGPKVLTHILEWLGFEATATMFWRQHPPPNADRGRIRIVAARDASALAALGLPPAIEILVPDDGSTVSGTIALDAGAADDVVDVVEVSFHLTDENHERTVLGLATRTWDGWIYPWDTGAVTNGTYTLSAMAVDAAGNSGQSAAFTITVRN